METAVICERCRSTETRLVTVPQVAGSVGVIGVLFLWWVFAKAGLSLEAALYAALAAAVLLTVIALLGTRVRVCKACGSTALIPVDTPRGRELMQQRSAPR